MTIEQRVAKLEKQNRWMKRVGGLALAAVACVVLIGQGKPKELPDLVVKSITIKSPVNKAKVFIGSGEVGPHIRLHDTKGRVRVAFTENYGLFSSPAFKETTRIDGAGVFVSEGMLHNSVTIGSSRVVLRLKNKVRALLGVPKRVQKHMVRGPELPTGLRLSLFARRGEWAGVEVSRDGKAVWQSPNASPKK